MIIEIILIICVVVVLIIIAQYVPDLIKKSEDHSVSNSLIDKTNTVIENIANSNQKDKQYFFSNWFKKKKEEVSSTGSHGANDFWKAEQITFKDKNNFEIGDVYFGRGDYKEAEKYYLKAAGEDPHNPKIYNRLGIIYLEQKNYRDAKDAFQEVLKFDNKKPSRHVNYGIACMSLKNYKEAIESFEKACSLDPVNEKYKDMLADAKSKKKMFEKK
jgi:tetratricopeptide (TPR) repeat protein